MNVEMIRLETVAPIPVKDIATPQHHCATCLKMSPDLRCDVFERRVEPDYNKCYNHSHYQPTFEAYVEPSKELFKLMEEEDKLKAATDKNDGFKAA